MHTPLVFIDGDQGTTGLQIHARLQGRQDLRLLTLPHAERKDPQRRAEAINDADIALLCLPDDAAREAVAAIHNPAVRVIDASSAHRTTPGWVYGLPELDAEQPERIARAKRVSNPGCYPTAANLAIKPLVQKQLIDTTAGIVCDAKSGVSGAGRKPSMKTSFCEVADNFSAYSMLDHRHVPEVLLNSGLDSSQFSFVAQLIPIDRGILETIYGSLKPGTTESEVAQAMTAAYKDAAFVRLTGSALPEIKHVVHTNFCDIGWKVDAERGRIVLVAVIDNLVKGAAGSAVQNLNVLLGLDERTGLL